MMKVRQPETAAISAAKQAGGAAALEPAQLQKAGQALLAKAGGIDLSSVLGIKAEAVQKLAGPIGAAASQALSERDR